MDKKFKETYETDVVIVGSGVAGAMLSYELAKSGINVICLESGPPIDRAATLKRFKEYPERGFQECYVKTKHAPFPSGRPSDAYLESVGSSEYGAFYLRGVGGTTWLWAGNAWRFLEDDFKEKTRYGVGRDMPISYQDLEPFYDRAEVMMGVAGVSEPADYYQVKRKTAYPLPPVPLSYLDSYVDQKIKPLGLRVRSAPSARNTQVYDERPPCCGSNNCMPICPIGAQYSASVHIEKAKQFKTMRLISDAVVDQVVSNDQKSVNYVQFRDPQGNYYQVKAKHYVLAAGAIETPKLMLMSKIGNDNVGRNLMGHPMLFVSFIAKEDVFPGRGPMVIGSITENMTGPFRSKHAGFRINLKNFVFMQDLVKQRLDSGKMGDALRQDIAHHSKRMIGMEIFLGQLPDPNNRVTLSEDRKDALGLPTPKVDYHIGTWTENAVKPAYDVCKSIAEACGYEPGSLIFESESLDPKRRFNSNNHIMGTTIMGNDPKDSVANSIGQPYSSKDGKPMENLFIASSGLMSTSGVNNVSLTIAALSLRLAEHLEKQYQHGEV
jgi:choline dehydrogenase-like flavoprotein